jgi:amino-acid N-acetyltransferase
MTPADLPALLDLLNAVNLPQEGLAAQESFGVLARRGPQVVGSAVIEVHGEAGLLRSVAVLPAAQGEGLGQRLTLAILEQAEQRGIQPIYLLTETAERFFPRFGFHPIHREEVAPAIQQSIEFTTACPASAVVMVNNG